MKQTQSYHWISVLVVYVFIAVVSWSVRLSHPAMTETQLFLAFWPWWLAAAALAIGLAWWVRHEG